jgi:hypothetical protein
LLLSAGLYAAHWRDSEPLARNRQTLFIVTPLYDLFHKLISFLASESSSLWNRTNLPRDVVAVAAEARNQVRPL